MKKWSALFRLLFLDVNAPWEEERARINRVRVLWGRKPI
jgi:hypothetical protein